MQKPAATSSLKILFDHSFILLCLLYTELHMLFPGSHHSLRPWDFTPTNRVLTLTFYTCRALLNRTINIHKTKDQEQWLPFCIFPIPKYADKKGVHQFASFLLSFPDGQVLMSRMLDSQGKLFLKNIKVAGITCGDHVSSWRITGLKREKY